MRDRKFAVRFTSEDVKLTNLLIEDSRPKRGYLFNCVGDDKEDDRVIHGKNMALLISPTLVSMSALEMRYLNMPNKDDDKWQ